MEVPGPGVYLEQERAATVTLKQPRLGPDSTVSGSAFQSRMVL